METKAIFCCADHREFLRLCMQNGKKRGGLRALAKKAGFKSPGHLTMLVQGERKLTSRSAELLARALALKGRSRSLWLAFARLDSGRTEKEKMEAREDILRLKSYRPEFRLSAAQYSFLAHWYYPTIYALLPNLAEPTNPEGIARRLGRGVTAAQVAQALQDLQFLGLVQKEESGAWKAVHAAIATPEEVRDLAVGKYHRNMLELAEEALALPLETREFNGLTVAIPARLLPKVKEKLRAFRMELNEMLSRETEAAEVYQLNLQLFPLTQGLERKEP